MQELEKDNLVNVLSFLLQEAVFVAPILKYILNSCDFPRHKGQIIFLDFCEKGSFTIHFVLFRIKNPVNTMVSLSLYFKNILYIWEW